MWDRTEWCRRRLHKYGRKEAHQLNLPSKRLFHQCNFAIISVRSVWESTTHEILTFFTAIKGPCKVYNTCCTGCSLCASSNFLVLTFFELTSTNIFLLQLIVLLSLATLQSVILRLANSVQWTLNFSWLQTRDQSTTSPSTVLPSLAKCWIFCPERCRRSKKALSLLSWCWFMCIHVQFGYASCIPL